MFILNGVNRTTPYVDSNGVEIFVTPGKLELSTLFGLTIIWDGYTSVQVLLCDSYAGHVCGLCGNGDGKNIRIFA